jgi:hypothetical protein
MERTQKQCITLQYCTSAVALHKSRSHKKDAYQGLTASPKHDTETTLHSG